MAVRRVSHLGLCVSDAARSERFWCEALGFRRLAALRFDGEPTATLLGVAGCGVDAIYLERDDWVLELLCFSQPGQEGRAQPRPVNRAGFTHLSFQVEALDPVLERVVACGGRVLEGSRINNPATGSRAVFVTDPDLTRIELVEGRFDPRQLGGS